MRHFVSDTVRPAPPRMSTILPQPLDEEEESRSARMQLKAAYAVERHQEALYAAAAEALKAARISLDQARLAVKRAELEHKEALLGEYSGPLETLPAAAS